MAAAADVFDWLLGQWTFVREIPGYANVRGEARVTPTGEGEARYEETAVVSLVRGGTHSGTLRATQCYQFRRLPAPVNGIDVLFCQTGELFERLIFDESSEDRLEARARFLCAADVYESAFAIDRVGRLHVEHVVRGPKKNYRVETIYSRSSEAIVSAATNCVRGRGYNP